MCDPSGTGSLTRDGLYKSLALAAVAQEGRAVEERALKSFRDSELPTPTIATVAELRDTCLKLHRVKEPTELGLVYDELRSMDDVSVTLVPEKQGVVFKHVEYIVESKAMKSSVRRRYKDFESLYEILLSKYPYRLIPRIPPKKVAASSTFIEQRRRALKRFLLLIVRHPVLAKDEVVRLFLTTTGHEVGGRLKDKFKNPADEFFFNEQARSAEKLVTEANRRKYERVHEGITLVHRIISWLLQAAHNLEGRSMGLSHDMKQLSAGLSTLATDSSLIASWTSGSDEAWAHMRGDCQRLADKFSILSRKAQEQAAREAVWFTDSVHLFLDLITSYQDLCDRRERTVQRKHQKALAKVQTMVTYKEHMESQRKHMSEREDSRMLRRDDELQVIEKRNFFSLFCLDLEAQLVHVNLAQLPGIFQGLVASQIRGCSEFTAVWEELKAIVDSMGGGELSSRRTKTVSTSSDDSPLHQTRSPFQ